MNWYGEAFSKYATFRERARRKEYWTFTLINTAIALVIATLELLLGFSGTYGDGPISTVFIFIIALPSLAVSVRRLHDIGQNGWLVLIMLIPVLGTLILIGLALKDSEFGDNQYGAYPKA